MSSGIPAKVPVSAPVGKTAGFALADLNFPAGL